ncbi:MAG: DUF11 domain-containing protein, partial [Acidobacteriales bacterium]|nr:DUF11 domain-containing protein [Terriglobales bacterium]
MKTKRHNATIALTCVLAGALLAGCAQQQRGAYRAASPAPAPKAAEQPKPAPATRGYGPSYATIEEGGVKFTKGSMAFPTGLRESSGLLVEKIVPVEVLAGQAFEYQIKVSNLTDYPIHLVTLVDRVTDNFKTTDADPKADESNQGVATWRIGNMGPKETKLVKVRGSASAEGTIDTCAWASYSPILCEDIKIVKANMQLAKKALAEAIICDPIPMTLTVKNIGSSALTGVKVTDTLPDGLTSDGKKTLTFDVGTLAPGQSRDLTFNATAASTGRFVNNAKATSTQGIIAEASSTTVVHQPVLNIACKAPEERFIGRPFEVCFTVSNKGDAAAAGSVLELPIPAGLSFNSATAGGRASGNNVVWDLGSLAANASKDVCATFTSAKAGTFTFNGTSKGTCAKPVSTTCQTRVLGI